jgi:hypothetical protein
MDHIDETLTTQSRDIILEPSIRAALSIAKKTLNKYYDKTDQSEVYRIAMSRFSFYICIWCILMALSSAPPPQIEILRERWLANRLDHHR